MVPDDGPITVTVGAALSLRTVTVAVVDAPVPPFESRATAAMKCVPFSTAVVSHGTGYGDVVVSAPETAPSTENWEPAIEGAPTPRAAARLGVAAAGQER